jgi:DNA-binding NarL/FixJ family response regulator
VLLIKDHPLTLSGIASCLNDTGRFSIAGTAASLAAGTTMEEGNQVQIYRSAYTNGYASVKWIMGRMVP